MKIMVMAMIITYDDNSSDNYLQIILTIIMTTIRMIIIHNDDNASYVASLFLLSARKAASSFSASSLTLTSTSTSTSLSAPASLRNASAASGVDGDLDDSLRRRDLSRFPTCGVGEGGGGRGGEKSRKHVFAKKKSRKSR